MSAPGRPLPTASAQALDITARLIGFDTVSRNSNLALIDWVANHVDRLGASVRLTRNAAGEKANLLATWGDPERAGIVLSGHTDVVPVDGQDWSCDPFQATIRANRLYGRGACDMKGFIGACLAVIGRLPARGAAAPVHLALSYDEELGCLGVGALLDDMRQAGIAPAGCIVGEPTNMQVVVGHKGKRAYRCCVKGHAAHSSMTTEGVNAVEYASDLICRIRSEARELRATHRQSAFDVPFTTLTTTTISGGVSLNTIADLCEFTFEYRYLPGVDPDRIIAAIERYAREALVPEMRKCAASADIVFSRLSAYPGLSLDEQSALATLAKSLRRTQSTGKVAFGTEGGLFQAAGVPALVCGPGSILQAHKADEYVELAQLAECEDFLAQIIQEADRLAAG